MIGGACLLFAHVALRLNQHQACKVTDSGPDDPLHPSVGADKAGEIRVQERGRRQRRRSVLVQMFQVVFLSFFAFVNT